MRRTYPATPDKQPRKTHLGWLGPVIVLVGIAASAVAVWYMRAARPIPGDVIDEIALGGGRTAIIRAEAKSDRNFLELREGGAVKWQALVPHYAGKKGRPGIAWSDKAITIRVERSGGRAEVFAFALENAQKLGAIRLAPQKEPITLHADGPLTLTDHVHAFELVGGDGWREVIAIDLRTGQGAWEADLGAAPIMGASVEPGRLVVLSGSMRRVFDATTGKPAADDMSPN